MNIEDNILPGRFNEVITQLRQSVSQYIRHNGNFKIGLTKNPPQRASNHKQAGWNRMVLIYRTTSKKYTIQMEQALIQHGWNYSYDESWNWREGGGGVRESEGKYYYVYILLE